MKNARMSGPPVGDTLIDFLRRAVERYGPRDALLFKPAFGTSAGAIHGYGTSQARLRPSSSVEA